MFRSFESVIIVMFFLFNTEVLSRLVSNHYSIVPCFDSNFKEVLKATSVYESRQKSTLQCAMSCNKHTQCDYAIFRHALQKCSHISNANYTVSDVSSFDESENCSIIRKNLKCQNGGIPSNYVCHCPIDWAGRQCEYPNWNFCQSGSWRQLQSNEHGELKNTLLQMKAINRGPTSTNVEHLTFFTKHNNIIHYQSNNFLRLNSSLENFDLPLKKVIRYFSSSDNILENYYIGMTGDMTRKEETPNIELWIRGSMDIERPVFQRGVSGSVDQICDGLKQGYRLLNREFTRVGFNKESGDAHFEGLRTNVGASTKALSVPPYYYTYKTSMKTGQYFVLRTTITTGNVKSCDATTLNTQWKLDRCWVKIKPSLEYDEFTNVLKDFVLMGYDMRLVIGESISTDITMVTVTTNDVIASLADYLSPFDESSPLNETAKIRFPLISRSKVFSECEKDFLGSTVYNQSREMFTGKLDWFVSSRHMKKLLTSMSDGRSTYGSNLEVYNAVTQGLKNVRVCVDLSDGTDILADGSLWTCFGSTAITANNVEKHVQLQSQPVMKAAVHNNGSFLGIEDANCRYNVILVSTRGWVKKAVYSPGTVFSNDDVKNVTFQSISFFVEL